MSRKVLRVDIELDDKQAAELEALIDEDYDEAMDKAELIMMDMPCITNIDVAEIH